MSHFVNTNFVFSCYFSVLFSPRMPAISFHLAIVPSYLFIYHRSHIINVMQTVTGNVCVNSNKSATRTSLFPCYFLANLPHFQYNHDIGAFGPASLYAGNFFTSYWFLRFSCSVFSMISMTIFILTHSKGKR